MKRYYEDYLADWENLVRTSTAISQAVAGRRVSVRLVYASMLFTRLVGMSVSVLLALPKNGLVIAEFENWDFTSIAALSRNFLEAYHVFYYLVVEDIDEKEEECRFLICELHANLEKLKLFREAGVTEKELEMLIQGLEQTKEQIKKNDFFFTFSPKKQKKLLEGRDALYFSTLEISERIGKIKTGFFKYSYRLFSNHVHTAPFSFFTMSEDRGRGLENEAEKDYISFSILLNTYYLGQAVSDILRLFPDIIQKMPLEEVIFVNVIQEKIYKELGILQD